MPPLLLLLLLPLVAIFIYGNWFTLPELTKVYLGMISEEYLQGLLHSQLLPSTIRITIYTVI